LDRDRAKAAALVSSLDDRIPCRIGDIADLSTMDGVVNCTPLGMDGYSGSPVTDGLFPQNRWAFDAVYTPVETQFRAQALATGAAFLSGYELFYHQGIHAFEIFTGHRIENSRGLRNTLRANPRLLA
jgi:shikimate dehydrogenase